LSSGSGSARTVLYRRSSGTVVDGEIVVEAQKTDRSRSGEDPDHPSDGTPPAITRD